MSFSCVNDKISGVFKTVIRPLKEGEQGKRPGDTTVFEALNEVSDGFKAALESGEPITVSYKIDGTCCKIMNGIYYRRRDIRKGSVPPTGSILGDVDESGHANIAWIPLNDSKDPEDKFHLSAFCDSSRLSVWVLNKDKTFDALLLKDVQVPTTFELVGPKVQDNLYELDVVNVQVETRKKTETVPRHYLIPHGAFTAPFDLEIFKSNNALDQMREFCIRNKAEGLVFRCGDKYFKVNQGHLQCHEKNSKLLLAGL